MAADQQPRGRTQRVERKRDGVDDAERGGVVVMVAPAVGQHLAVAWGFAEVLPNKVTILAETAERPSEIDVDRARKAKQRAEQRLTSGDTSVDVDRALDALHRAEARIEVASEK